MAELKCKDGVIVQISNETEQELREAFGPKETYTVGDIFWRDTSTLSGNHYVQLVKCDGLVGLHAIDSICPDGTMSGFRGVRDIHAITLDEVRRMTVCPEGLRKAGQLVITEK